VATGLADGVRRFGLRDVSASLVAESDGTSEPSEWFISYDADAVLESVRDLAARAPPFGVACVCHGDPIARAGDEALGARVERI